MNRLGLFAVLATSFLSAGFAEEPDGSEKFAAISVNASRGIASRYWEVTNSDPDRAISVTYAIKFRNPAWRSARRTIVVGPDSATYLGPYRLQGTSFAVVSTRFVPAEPGPSPTASPSPPR
jgi:hypothetical protein